ncbi:MAG TPA: sigma-70 family RNA polymerase sigma factor [Bacteroidia bacterium]|nr:sigma-70 family RNA polymerase sigma factor [Bacteroidia bacterium]
MQFFRQSLKKYSDEELMQRAGEGNSRAFDELYGRYSARLFTYFHRMLWKNKELAEDCLHRLFLKIIEKPELFNTEKNFKTWIYSAAHNMCKNEYRRMEQHKNADDTVQSGVGSESLINIKDDYPLPGNMLDNKLFMRSLENELDSLSENHRQTFTLRYFEHLSLKEIADIMECSEGTVKSRLFYALKQLADKLKPFKNLLQL